MLAGEPLFTNPIIIVRRDKLQEVEQLWESSRYMSGKPACDIIRIICLSETNHSSSWNTRT